MTIDLLCVLEDGSRRDPTVPRSVRKLIAFAAGQDVRLRLRVITPAGTPADITSSSILFTARRTLTSEASLSKAAILAPQEGPSVAVIDITSLESKNLGGRYIYDIWRIKSAIRDPIMLPSQLIIEPMVTPV